jgi:hypothetical protein
VYLVTQSFGNAREYNRATFAILSLFAVIPKKSEFRVLLFTDNPEYFQQRLAGLSVRYILLTTEKIRQLRGDIDFLHRMKIGIIEEAFEIANDSLLYADSDTFFLEDPTHLFNSLTSNIAFFHLKEHSFKWLEQLPLPSGKTFHAFLHLIRAQQFKLADGRRLTVHDSQYSWNAGVMILHHTAKKFLGDVYDLTDAFFPLTRNHASEQYAFSIILQNHVELRSCETVVHHYWHHIKKQIVDDFLLKNMTDTWLAGPIEGRLRDVQMWSNHLVRLFPRHVLMLRYNAVQEFWENRFRSGYWFMFRALLRNPFDSKFMRDVLYHTRRGLLSRK